MESCIIMLKTTKLPKSAIARTHTSVTVSLYVIIFFWGLPLLQDIKSIVGVHLYP